MNGLFVKAMVLTSFLAQSVFGSDWQLELGVGVSRFSAYNLQSTTEVDTRGSLSGGVYRVINDRIRAGSGFTVLAQEPQDWGGSRNVIAAKLADLDVRVTSDIALNINLGFARFYREQSAYGYSYGGGVKYRLNDNWYLAADLGYANTDASTNVPINPGANHKDNLKWYNFSIRRIF